MVSYNRIHSSKVLPPSRLLPVSNGQLKGLTDLNAALVQQYINLADNEILPAACTWVFPTLGIMQYNKQVCMLSVFMSNMCGITQVHTF